MTFKEILKKENIAYVTEPTEFKRYAPKNSDKALAFVKEILDNNLKVLIFPDPDPDGFYAGLCWKQMFDRTGHKNYKVYQLTKKIHGISDTVVSEAITEGYEAIVIVDSSSNNMSQLETLSREGIRTLIVDHHESGFSFESYPQGCDIINPRIEMKTNPNIPYKELSACFVCALVCDYILNSLGKRSDYSFYIYGYITLYSDTCDLGNPYNLSIINKFCKTKLELPKFISYFMESKYDTLCRNFVSYRLVPRLNALIRLEQFDLIYKLFYTWDRLKPNERVIIKQQIEDYYKLAKDITKRMEQLATSEVIGNVVVLQLDGIAEAIKQPPRIVRNFTGLVCQSFTESTGLAAFSLISVNDTTFQGSCRDSLNRDVLNAVKPLCKAGGHPSAFGIELRKRDFSRWVLRVIKAIKQLDANKEFFVISEDSPGLADQICQLADYNEISGTGNLPMIYISLEVTSDMKIHVKDNYTSIMWGSERIVSFENNIEVGDVLYLKPTVSINGYQLLVNNKVG